MDWSKIAMTTLGVISLAWGTYTYGSSSSKDVNNRLGQVEIKQAVVETNITNINQRLDNIDKNLQAITDKLLKK